MKTKDRIEKLEYIVSTLRADITDLECKLKYQQEQVAQLTCPHPVEHQQMKSDLTSSGFIYYALCGKCNKTLKRFDSRADMLRYHLGQLSKQVNKEDSK